MNWITVNGKRNFFTLIVSILLSEGIGFLSGTLSMTSPDQYEALVKPEFAPPAWIFGIVWVLLYFLMGLAAYRIWMIGIQKTKVQNALALYMIQLALNFLWSFIFFKYQNYSAAFIELLILWFFILWTTVEFFELDKKTGWLMIPYILWVSFAAVLNYFIWQLNR